MPQAHTHKTDSAEVLLTDWQRTGPSDFTVHANWPGAHPFYEVRHGLHDPLRLSETVRQTFPLLSHSAFHVPFGHHLLWQTYDWNLLPALLRFDGDAADLELRIGCDRVKYRKGRASALSLSMEVYRNGVQLADARTDFTVQDPEVYARLRGGYADVAHVRTIALPAGPPVPADQVGRGRADDVVLSPTSGAGWQLRVDTSHRFLFDHPVDHTPGMLLLEAARQAAYATVRSVADAAVVIGMETRFRRYAELDTPCWITAHPYSDDDVGVRRVLVTARQSDQEIFTALVTLTGA
ncbi:ScbA/BarX family gamma-butyrolactone biosynthesis protein [Streptomyces sp. AM 2-1-1]|uniref:ScbA/BarX family gamma-butyrolactone biosynthesis protein n=1 Tax=Streptomyces sp. AM 2-1-1 TaxID=3028709 RepID=UPI0023B937A3|nr:ScbA/BarX family gamma-butyrolactone biosynthesis protein [Streptomyces sp. AM 2-1-1]WEH39239.1 ScbA/BarX family gamma-butyrolactone biosynthesis protein [Streptomyces sp. AM 2-1-1]